MKITPKVFFLFFLPHGSFFYIAGGDGGGGLCWDHFGTILGSFWDRFGTILYDVYNFSF